MWSFSLVIALLKKAMEGETDVTAAFGLCSAGVFRCCLRRCFRFQSVEEDTFFTFSHIQTLNKCLFLSLLSLLTLLSFKSPDPTPGVQLYPHRSRRAGPAGAPHAELLFVFVMFVSLRRRAVCFNLPLSIMPRECLSV